MPALMRMRHAADGVTARRAVLTRLLVEHDAGTHDHARRLWALVCLELWQRRVRDGAV